MPFAWRAAWGLRLRCGPQDRILQKTSFRFDASVWEFYGPLRSGGQLIMLKAGAHRDVRYLGEQMTANGITVVQMVPTLLQAVLDASPVNSHTTRTTAHDKPQKLRLVMCGGEALRLELAKPVWERWGAEVV